MDIRTGERQARIHHDGVSGRIDRRRQRGMESGTGQSGTGIFQGGVLPDRTACCDRYSCPDGYSDHSPDRYANTGSDGHADTGTDGNTDAGADGYTDTGSDGYANTGSD